MALKFDATLKDMVRQYLADFEQTLGLTTRPPGSLLNVDLSTLTAATDVAIGHGDPPESITDLNFQSGPDPTFDRRVLLYAAVLHYRYAVPIHSVAVLLRPEADSPGVAGKLSYAARRRRSKMKFSYEVIRMWRQPVERFLRGGLGTLPLATLCRLSPTLSAADALPAVIRRIDERLREAPQDVARRLLTATYVLTGLRLTKSVADDVFGRVTNVRESSTYQGILEEGRTEGRIEGRREARLETLQQTVLRLGRIRFGASGRRVSAAVKAVTDAARLERWTEQVLTATSWDELLATP